MKSLHLPIWAVIFYVSASFADETVVSFHLGCSAASSECHEQTPATSSGPAVLVQKKPVMNLSRNDITTAEVVSKQNGQEQIQLVFDTSTTEKLAQITERNIGEQLVVLAKGKVLQEFPIKDAIKGGSVVMSLPADSSQSYFEGLPWKRATDEKKIKNEALPLPVIVCALLLGVLMLASAVYFSFFRKKPSVSIP